MIYSFGGFDKLDDSRVQPLQSYMPPSLFCTILSHELQMTYTGVFVPDLLCGLRVCRRQLTRRS